MKFDTFTPTVPFCRRYEAISLLCANCPESLDHLFNEMRTSLGADPLSMLSESWSFEPRRKVLHQLAIGMWTQKTPVMLHEAYHHLSGADFEGFVLALECLNSSPRGECDCQFCRHAVVSPPESEIELSYQ